ncbi:long-chain-fatty-acid--CoA ligase ACSBG2-like isoform X2 [Hyla sarda]|uniref:long-chain-fatty-acid--CoA ligase ACSBG2-like isoform X2 n=1 Tax=Hyla sarda TaxID=327740 RepID=UPI0024C3C7B5|nr:long-chain-fatty-acid--CoA ligase ACSBG2-like isoform X2 [Hyla sarda]
MGICCLHMCQGGGNGGEKSSPIDMMDGDSTESFVEISGNDETEEEKEQLESQSEPGPSSDDQEPEASQITCDYEVKQDDPACEEAKQSPEPPETGKNMDHENETLETNTGDGRDCSPEGEDLENVQDTQSETLGPEEHAGQDIPTEQEMTKEDHEETQTAHDGSGSPQETTCGGSQNMEEHNESSVSNQPEPHDMQEDERSMEPNPKYGSDQESAYREESNPVHAEDTMEGPQDAKEREQKAQNDVMYEESPESKDMEDSAENKVATQNGDQDQPGRTTEDMSGCEERSLEQPRMETVGSDRSETLWTCRTDGEITLRMEVSGAAALCPVTVPQLFSKAVKKYGQKVALCVRASDGWQEMTYSQYELQCRAVARGFLKLGLKQFQSVLILGCNSPEWFMAEIGAVLAGGVAVCIAPESTESFCLKVALDVQVQIVLVDDHKQLAKILQIQEKLPTLKAMVQWTGQVMDPRPGMFTWNQLVNLGSELEESYLDVVMADQKPHQCCAVMYSEGAGEPRGAMISHDNVTWTSRAMQEMLGLGSEVVVVSHLPLCHMSVQMFDLWLPLSCGGTTYFAKSEAQKGSLVSMLCDVQPTLFLGFPGLWKKVQKKWILVEKRATPLQKMTIQWARRKSRLSYTSSGSLLWGHSLAEHLVFRPARRALGLDSCTLCYAGMEPISQDVAEYLRSLGIDLLELYGKNETSGVQSIMVPSSRRTGRVELTGCKSRVNQDELSLWGRHIFLGYLGREQETNEAFTEDGWWRTVRNC